jgi:hypothetical protein
MGDFNEILFSHEKEGGNQRPQPYMQSFRGVLSECALEDLREVGLLYSVGTPIWRKSQSIGTPWNFNYQSCLERALEIKNTG